MKSLTLGLLLILNSGLALAQNHGQVNVNLCPKIIPLLDNSVDSKHIKYLYEHYKSNDGWSIQELNYSINPQNIRKFTITVETEDANVGWLSGHLKARQIYCELPLSWEATVETIPQLRTPRALFHAKDTRIKENGTELILSETIAGVAIDRLTNMNTGLVWFLDIDATQSDAIQNQIKTRYPFITELDVSVESDIIDASNSVIAMRLQSSPQPELNRGNLDELWWAEKPGSMIGENESFFPNWNPMFDDLTQIPDPWGFAARNSIRHIEGFHLLEMKAGRYMDSGLCFAGNCVYDAFYKLVDWHHANLKRGGVLHVTLIFQFGPNSYAKGEYVFDPKNSNGFQLLDYKTFPSLAFENLLWLENFRRDWAITP